MDASHFDGVTRAIGVIGARRQVLGALAGSVAGVLGLVATTGKKKKKKVTLCLNGATIKVPKKKQKSFLNQGATTGACTPPCVGSCAGKACGADDGCGGECGCATGQVCHDGTCMACNVTCASTPTACGVELKNRITAGGTIYACPGRYIGNFLVDMNNVTIVGAGGGSDPATSTILDGNNVVGERVLQINQNRTVHLEGLRLTGGNDDGPGGGIRNQGTLTIARCTITGNSTTSGSGGISHNAMATGTMTITDSTISGNNCAGSGGGLTQSSGTRSVTLTNCVITGNIAGVAGGGISVTQGTVNVTGGSITQNTADDGGGVFVTPGATFSQSGVTISGNEPNQVVNG